jgi:hypothetical protein
MRKLNEINVCHVTEFFFIIKDLSRNVDNSDGGSLVAGVHNLDLLKKEQSYLEVSISDIQEHQLGVYPEKESLCFNKT